MDRESGDVVIGVANTHLSRFIRPSFDQGPD